MDAPIGNFIAWMQADSEHRDRVASMASEAFDRAFREAVRA